MRQYQGWFKMQCLREIRNYVPRLTSYKVIVLCALSTCLLFLAFYSRVEEIFGQSNLLPSSPHTKTNLSIVVPGETIQVGDLEVHIATAVHYDNFPAKNGFNVFLNGWAKNDKDMNFKCCFVQTASSSDVNRETFTEVQSFTYKVYNTKWTVDMQNAEFTCSIPREQLAAIGVTNFSYVTFVKDSCHDASSVAMEILFPKPALGSLGICLKITYGSLNPAKMVEWFEYSRMMKVTKVFTYYFDVDPPVYKVLEYYNSIGYLDMLPIHPAKSKDGPVRGFRRPRNEHQAWVDEVMAANDCKHRMAAFDYVIVLDMDEFIVPSGDLTSYYDILQETKARNPEAGCLQFDSYVVLLDWEISREEGALHMTRHVQRTTAPNWNGSRNSAKYGFSPNMTSWVQTHKCHPRHPFQRTNVPETFCKMFHYRYCKSQWEGCDGRERVNDTTLAAYELTLVDRILSLPLNDILYNNTDYVNKVKKWRKKRRKKNNNQIPETR